MYNLTFPAAKHKLITHRGKFKDVDNTQIQPQSTGKATKQKIDLLHNTILQHPFQHQLEILLPSTSSSSSISISSFTTSLSSTPLFYYHIEAPLSVFLSSAFLVPLLQTGSFSAISFNTPIDHCNSFQLTHTHLLIFRVDNDTYEQLGLTGQRIPAHVHGKMGGFWEIQIQIKSEKWKTGEKQYERIMWCVQQQRMTPIQLLVQHTQQQDRCVEINFPPSISVIQRIAVDTQSFQLDNIQIPNAQQAFSSSLQSLPRAAFSSTTTKKRNELAKVAITDSECLITELFDWLGLSANRLNDLLLMVGNQPQLSPVDHPTLDYPLCSHLPFNPAPSSITAIRYSNGLFNPNHVISLLNDARALVDQGTVPWCAVYIWGISDSCVSWFDKIHDCDLEQGNGENDAIIVILPQQQYLLYMMVNQADPTH